MRKMLLCLFAAGLLLGACSPAGSLSESAPTGLPAGLTQAAEPTDTPEPVEPTERTQTPRIVVSTPTPRIESATPAPTRTPGLAPVGAIALEHIKALAWGIGQRSAGTPEEVEAAEYIRSTLEQLGYDARLEPFRFKTKEGREIESNNVVAVKPGASARQIIVGAHMDTVSIGTGADDNASGVGVMLEAAERIKDLQTPYTIRFVAFGSEELGMQGSNVFVKKMTPQEVKDTVLMVNLDSLLAGDIAYVYGDAGGRGKARDWLLEQAKAENLPLVTQTGENPQLPAGTTGDWSDHAPFLKEKIPYAYFEATNWMLGAKDGYTQTDLKYGVKGEIWHTPFDTLDYVEKTFPGRTEAHLKLFTTLLVKLLQDFPG
jgi:hypothetical protein